MQSCREVGAKQRKKKQREKKRIVQTPAPDSYLLLCAQSNRSQPGSFSFFLYLSLLLLLLLKCEWPRIVWASRNTICLSGGARGPLQWSKGGYKRLVTRGQPTNNHKHPSYFSPTTHPPLVSSSPFFLSSLSLSLAPLFISGPFFSS